MKAEMTERTMKYYQSFIRNHHDDSTFQCIEKCYRLWYYLHCKADDVKLLTFMKECGLTDENIYTGLAIGILSPWIKKKDLYFDSDKYYKIVNLDELNILNRFGEVATEIKVYVNLDTLPKTVEEYLAALTSVKANKSLKVNPSDDTTLDDYYMKLDVE